MDHDERAAASASYLAESIVHGYADGADVLAFADALADDDALIAYLREADWSVRGGYADRLTD